MCALLGSCVVCAGNAGASSGSSDGSRVVFTDAPGDASLRRTDATLAAPLPSVTPDLLTLTVGGWTTSSPTTDPYTGSWRVGQGADLVRVDLVVAGLVNPPGTRSPFAPTKYGPRPLIAFVELDVDNNRDTGGECEAAEAQQRYLANVGRFGALPHGSYAQRAARNSSTYTDGYSQGAQFERTGAEFVLSLCGCDATTVVDRFGDQTPETFDAGETWIIRNRGFVRAGAFNGEVSAFTGGSAFGMFDPLVTIRFKHDVATYRTTVSLVFPLTMAGAAALAGQPAQPADASLTNHTSVYEALLDIVDSVPFAAPGCQADVMSGWSAATIAAALDPSTWNATALLGVPYTQAAAFPYAFTDVGFDETVGDLNADGVVGPDDEALFATWLSVNDGGASDADGAVNGAFAVQNRGPNFQLHDFTNDGLVDGADRAVTAPRPPCIGDVDGDHVVNFNDLNIVVTSIGLQGVGIPADLNHDGIVNFQDLNLLLTNFGVACP